MLVISLKDAAKTKKFGNSMSNSTCNCGGSGHCNNCGSGACSGARDISTNLEEIYKTNN